MDARAYDGELKDELGMECPRSIQSTGKTTNLDSE